MTTINIIILIIIILLVISGIIFFEYKYRSEKLLLINNKLLSSKEDFNEKISNKFDMLNELIEEIIKKYKIESKTFDETKKLNNKDLSNIKNEKQMNKCYKEILQIIEDNKNKKENKNITELINNYEDNELNIISLRTYYNKYTMEFNNMLKKFPYNIISTIKRYKTESLIEGQELSNNFNNDLEV